MIVFRRRNIIKPLQKLQRLYLVFGRRSGRRPSSVIARSKSSFNSVGESFWRFTPIACAIEMKFLSEGEYFSEKYSRNVRLIHPPVWSAYCLLANALVFSQFFSTKALVVPSAFSFWLLSICYNLYASMTSMRQSITPSLIFEMLLYRINHRWLGNFRSMWAYCLRLPLQSDRI